MKSRTSSHQSPDQLKLVQQTVALKDNIERFVDGPEQVKHTYEGSFIVLSDEITMTRAGNIDCRELVIGLSAILEGEDSFAKFVFDMFDEGGSGVLQPDEVENFTRVGVFEFEVWTKLAI